MLSNTSSAEQRLFDVIRQSGESLGYPVFLVGGFVRDLLLNIHSNDIDIVCQGSGIRLAEEVASRIEPTPQIAVYKNFGTALVKQQDFDLEFVGARKESYRADSRKPIVEDGTIEDDQKRRDFTINALAISLNKENYGELIDPFGGLTHLEEKLIVTPLEPGRTFSDDPLRMLRAIRFAAQLNFVIHDETLTAIITHKERINIVSKERITGELNKMLMCPVPSVAFKLLLKTGLVEILLPDVAKLQGVEYVDGKGHKDNFFHTLEVVDNVSMVSDNLWLRWAALLHDIAKPRTKRFEEGHGWTFHGHDAIGAAMVPRIFRNLRLPMDSKMEYVKELVRLHLRPISLTKEEITDSAMRRLLYDAGDNLEDLLKLCSADITSKNVAKRKRYRENYDIVRARLEAVEENDRMRNWQPPITGEEIMKTFGIAPSPLVGQIKTAIREAILDGDLTNDYDAAYAFMLELGRKHGLTSTGK
jgi:putative nucleotidyltransferase with HDIG domain